MSNHRHLAVLDAADLVAAEVNRLIDQSPRRLLQVAQLRESAGAIGANIREGFGRGKGKERNHSLRIARGEAEETVGHLKTNLEAGRLPQKTFWGLRDRLATIVKMITSLLNG